MSLFTFICLFSCVVAIYGIICAELMFDYRKPLRPVVLHVDASGIDWARELLSVGGPFTAQDQAWFRRPISA